MPQQLADDLEPALDLMFPDVEGDPQVPPTRLYQVIEVAASEVNSENTIAGNGPITTVTARAIVDTMLSNDGYAHTLTNAEATSLGKWAERSPAERALFFRLVDLIECECGVTKADVLAWLVDGTQITVT